MPGTILRNTTGPFISLPFQTPPGHSLALSLAGTTFSATLECTLDADSPDWVQLGPTFTTSVLYNAPVGPVKYRLNIASGSLLSAQYSSSLVQSQNIYNSFIGPDYSGAITTAQSTATAAQGGATSARSAIGNLLLSTLSTKLQADGPQFVNGSRWVWSSTGVINGGTVVADAGTGFWNRELTDGAVNARWFGLKGDGTDESALILSVLQAARGQGWRLTFPATAAYYNVGNGVEVLGVGDNYTVDAHPGAVFRTANATAPWVFAFTNTGSNFTFSGGILSWGVTPTVRGGAAAIYITGNQLINTVVENVRVLNSANFGVYCRAMASSGSRMVRFSNIQASNTLGDGCHVENYDHSITMSNIQTENNGDDAVAITQYTGTAGASTRFIPVTNVVINNVTSNNPTLAVVKLEGVAQAVVSNVTATGGASSSAGILLQLVAGPDYAAANNNIVLTGASANKLRAIFAVATVGVGNSHSKYVVTNVTGSEISGDPFYLAGVSGAGGDLSDVFIDGVVVSGAVGNTGRPLYASQVAGLHVRNFKAVGFAKSFQISDSFDVEVDNVEIWNPTTAVPGIILTTNNRIRYGRLIAMDVQAIRKMTIGLQIQANTDIRGFGGCDVRGQTGVAVQGGSNTVISGFVYEINGGTVIGALSARGALDGPQFIGSQRFDWTATGTPDGGTVVASNDGGFWVMDLSAGIVTPDLFGGNLQLALDSPNVTTVEINRNISAVGIVVPAGKTLRGRGGVITVPSGTYATPGGFTAAWCVRLAAGAVAENLTLAGNKAGALNVIGLYVEGGSGVTARRNTVSNFSLDGIRFRGATDFLIEGNSVVGCERSAIEAEIGARGRVRGNRVEDCRDGIKWWGGDGAVSDTIGISDLTIDANTVLNVGRPGQLAGGVWGSLGQRITVSNNVIVGANDVGIDFENCKDSSATGNIVKDCVNAGLANFYGGDNIQFTGNTVTQGNGAPAYKGFGGKTASNINLSNNSLITTGGIAVQTDGAGVIQNLQISGGTIRNTGAFPAVRLLESPRPSLTDVRITTEHKVAVQIEGCDKYNVKGCSILTSAALGGAADTIGNSGGVRAVWRSVTYKGQLGTIQGCEIRGFTHSVSDDNGGDYYSGLMTSGNRLSGDILHYAAPAAGYRGYHDASNRNADNPTSGATENTL